MIYIGICDDERTHREMIREMVSKSIFQYDDIEYTFYHSGNQVVEAIEKGEFSCELLLLDIHMPDKDGLETAAYIREHQIDVDIIFVTVSADHVFDGYTYRAFSYLLKPLDYDRLSDEMKRYMTLKENISRCLHVNIGGRKVQIFLDRVKYFAADGRKIIVCQRGGEDGLSFYAKMGDLQETLKEDGFLRCHQSYLVNVKYVESYSRTELEVGADKVPISRRYIEDVREYFHSQEG